MISLQQIALRLAIAAILGSIVGSERQRHEWAAGLRTHMVVCVGSALIMLVSMFGFGDVVNRPGIVLDPSRVAAQVISGIGFLGAGTILFLRREVVRGLTTAAGLWTVAAIGLAVGGGLYFAACITTAIIFVILAALKPIETRFFNKDKFNGVSLVLERKQVSLENIEKVFNDHQIKYTRISLSPSLEEDLDDMAVSIQKLSLDKKHLLVVIEDLRKIKGVREVSFTVS
jgi:putative Mg2+ transporter-C (MgtC) family protein